MMVDKIVDNMLKSSSLSDFFSSTPPLMAEFLFLHVLGLRLHPHNFSKPFESLSLAV